MTIYPFAEEQQPYAVRQKADESGLAYFFRHIGNLCLLKDIVFICIGTDRSTGDALGPLTGSKLEEYGFKNVVGTLACPCDAGNLEARLATIPPEARVVAIDACLGMEQSLGAFLVSAAPLLPAESVGGKLPAVGDFSIAGIVGKKGPKPYHALQAASLYRVMNMADQIAAAAAEAFGLGPNCR